MRVRVHDYWLLRTGRPALKVACILREPERGVQYRVSWYRLGGLDEVSRHRWRGVGKACWLSPQQRAEGVAQANSEAWRTVEDARHWIDSDSSRHPALAVVPHGFGGAWGGTYEAALPETW